MSTGPSALVVLTATTRAPLVYGAGSSGVTARSQIAACGSLCSHTGRKMPLNTHMSWFSR